MHAGEVIVPHDGGVLRVPGYEEILEAARVRYEAYESQIEYLNGRVKELEDEAYKDKRLAEMKEEVDSSRRAMSRGFPVTDKEWDEIHAWERKHLKEAHGIDVDETPNYGGAIGGNWTFTFIPTSIGVIGEVRCHCGEKFTFEELS